MFIILINLCWLHVGFVTWFDTKNDMFIIILNFRCKCVTYPILSQVSNFDDFTGRTIAATKRNYQTKKCFSDNQN